VRHIPIVTAVRIAACERLRRNGLAAETTAEIRGLRGIHTCCFTPRARGLAQVNRNVVAAGSNQLRRSSRIGGASGWPVFIFDHENHEFSGFSSARIGRLAMDIRGACVERLAQSESHGRRGTSSRALRAYAKTPVAYGDSHGRPALRAAIARYRAPGARDGINYKAQPEWAKSVLQLTQGHGAHLVVDVGGKANVGVHESASFASVDRVGFSAGCL